jgi:hypothetical protein
MNVRYCDCEDYPCCGHTDNPDGPHAHMTDAEIKQAVYDRYDDPDYDPDFDFSMDY